MCCGTDRALADPPTAPLDPPFYSFDAESPKVLSGLVHAYDILEVNDLVPNIAEPGVSLGLDQPGDDLDALSRDYSGLLTGQEFLLLFSVDRTTEGEAPPDPTLVDLHVPYNAKDQAEKGQAAGDQYMSTVVCTRQSICALPRRGLTNNSTLVRNNYDEGGTDFAADPPTSAEDTAARVPQDNVDATSALPQSPDPDREVLEVFFSASEDSPSLVPLSDIHPPSGANIFFNPHPANATSETSVFAAASALGLGQDDDIDAMIVFNGDGDILFTPGDQVMFSLTPGSPSLTTYLGSGVDAGGAYVFMVTHGEDPVVIATAEDLGLGLPDDNVDALDYVICPDAELCAPEFGIRSPYFPAVAGWGLAVTALLGLVAGTALFRRKSK